MSNTSVPVNSAASEETIAPLRQRLPRILPTRGSHRDSWIVKHGLNELESPRKVSVSMFEMLGEFYPSRNVSVGVPQLPPYLHGGEPIATPPEGRRQLESRSTISVTEGVIEKIKSGCVSAAEKPSTDASVVYFRPKRISELLLAMDEESLQ